MSTNAKMKALFPLTATVTFTGDHFVFTVVVDRLNGQEHNHAIIDWASAKTKVQYGWDIRAASNNIEVAWSDAADWEM